MYSRHLREISKETIQITSCLRIRFYRRK